jgi:hypothetical protein
LTGKAAKKPAITGFVSSFIHFGLYASVKLPHAEQQRAVSLSGRADGMVCRGEYLRLLIGKRILWIPQRISPVAIAAAVLVIAAFTILRNLPFYPFSWLAPGI